MKMQSTTRLNQNNGSLNASSKLLADATNPTSYGVTAAVKSRARAVTPSHCAMNCE